MSTRTDYDVIVVGAGPAGGMAALTAAQLGLRTALIEEHDVVGAPTHCSGKLQLHAFREFELPDHLIMNTLQAGAFYGPDGSVARVRRKEPDSHVVDRAVFDGWLADEAQRRGAELILNTRLRRAELRNGGIVVSGERARRSFSATATLVIDAEGARPVLPASLGLRQRRSHVLGLQYQMARLEIEEEDCPEIYLGASIAPGFFAWMMPIGDGRGRVGVCVDPARAPHSPVYYLERLLRDHPVASKRVARAVVERKLAGPIPILGRRGPGVMGRMLIAGDAAGHVKATSGGGIYFSLIAGRLAALAAHRWHQGDHSALHWYESQWRRSFGRELQFTAFARAVLNQMSDSEVNAFVSVMAEDRRFRQGVEEQGDTAYQSRLLSLVLTRMMRWSLVRPVGSLLVKALRLGALALLGGEPLPAPEFGRQEPEAAAGG